MKTNWGFSPTNFPRVNFPAALFVLFLHAFQAAELSGQTAPGGVSANLRGWYDASSNITLTGGAVSGWGDRSGNALNGSQGTAANRPAVNTTGFNYNQTLSFDGFTEYISIPDQVPSTATGVTAFAVARQTATNRDPFGMVLVGQANTSGSGGGYGLIAASAGNNVHGFAVNNYAGNNVFAASTLSEPTLMTGNFNGSTAGSLQYFRNGTSMGTDAYAGQVGDNGASFIGSAETTGNFCFYGDIAEVIVYSTGLSATSTTRVESYLALKYGLTKSGNYVNTSDAVVYNNTAPYNNDIIGIGRDDNTGLLQKQSRAYDDSSRVFISSLAATNGANSGSFSSGNQYLVMGHNNDRLSAQFTEMPGSIYSRIRREWKVTNTNFTGNFSFAIRLNALGAAAPVNGAHLRVLIDTDGDFTDATVINTGISASGGLITVSNITPADLPVNSTRYITVASSNANSPLPIELLSFESLMCGMDACIRWSTATETNNDHFEVERSADGSTWKMHGEIKGAGNSSTIRKYEYKDSFPFRGTSYYRLKQVDFDGTVTYSSISALNNPTSLPKKFSAFPNPADEELVIPGYLPSELQLYDPLGNEVMTEFSLVNGRNETVLSTAHLPSGIYILAVQAQAEERRSVRIVVSHR